MTKTREINVPALIEAARALDAAEIPDGKRAVILTWPQARDLGMEWKTWLVAPWLDKEARTKMFT